MALRDGFQRGPEIGGRLDAIEFAGFYERGDARSGSPAFVMACKEGVFMMEVLAD